MGSLDAFLSDFLPTPFLFQTGQGAAFPELLDGLTCLTAMIESTSNLDTDEAEQEMRRRVLAHLRQIVGAEGACLLLYHAASQHFIPVVAQGNVLCGKLVAALTQATVAPLWPTPASSPDETLMHCMLDGRCVLLVTLSMNDTVVGIVVLVLGESQAVTQERALLLTMAGRCAAWLLSEQKRQQSKRQELLEAERKRIASDLHDGLAQQLTHAQHRLEYVQRLLKKQQPEIALPDVKRAQQILQDGLRTLRYTIEGLLPEFEDERTLAEKLRVLVRDYRRAHPTLEVVYKVRNLDEQVRLPLHLERPLMSFVREALANVEKHAHATRITLQVRLFPAMLLVEIADNGIGFCPLQYLQSNSGSTKDTDEPHFGLYLMRQRIQAIGGMWELRSNLGQGTSVRVQLSLPADIHPDAGQKPKH